MKSEPPTRQHEDVGKKIEDTQKIFQTASQGEGEHEVCFHVRGGRNRPGGFHGGTIRPCEPNLLNFLVVASQNLNLTGIAGF